MTAEAGAAMLREGGNAVDAVVAAAFASFVAEPTLIAPGGGGFAMVYRRDAGRAKLYDFFCNFPGLGAPVPSEFDFFPISIDYGPATQEFHIGRGSVAVPGIIAGLCLLLADHGQLPASVVLEPAIHLARNGVRLGDFGALVGELLTPIFQHEPDLASLYGAPHRFCAPDFVYKNPQLADVFEALAREGPDLFYRGEIAQAILADQRAHGGLLTAQDLAEYEVIVREPLHQRYREFEMLTNPPPSRGGALIAFSLALLEAFDMARLTFGEVEHLALLAEVMRQTNLARPLFESTGDAARFLAHEHVIEHRRELVRRLADEPEAHALIAPTYREHNNTTHISVLDSDGVFVSMTTTAGETPGFLIPGYGLILNNILGEADLHPNGFHRGQPGRRIGSMMAPTIMLSNGEPVLALGSGGANRIRTAILQVILNFLDFNLDLPTAVNAPRIHFERDILQVEGGASNDVVDALARWGYKLNRWNDLHMFFGGVHAVGRDRAGRYQGAGDPRRNGFVAYV